MADEARVTWSLRYQNALLLMPLMIWATSASADSEFMKTGGRTVMPLGMFELCTKIPDECKQKTGSGLPTEFTDELWATANEINDSVNAIPSATDMAMWGEEEVWSYPDTNPGWKADTEDYVLEKRRRLMKAGLPPSNLLITVAKTPSGDGQALLTMRTTKGDFILDDREPRILPWRETDYRFLKRQSETTSGAWFTIEDDRGN
jgi:predicted transglutaminase-like cysteine proteinase